MSNYLKPDERRAQILEVALELAKRLGYMAITRDQVAREAEVSPGLVSHYFEDMTGLRKEVMRAAVRGKCLLVVAQGIANRHPVAMRAPRALRDQIRAIST